MRSTADTFRRLTIGDEATLAGLLDDRPAPANASGIPQTTISLVRIAALVATDAPGPAYKTEVERALAAGVSLDDLLAVLLAVAGQVGSARVIAAAPRVALAAGYDVDEDIDSPAIRLEHRP